MEILPIKILNWLLYWSRIRLKSQPILWNNITSILISSVNWFNLFNCKNIFFRLLVIQLVGETKSVFWYESSNFSRDRLRQTLITWHTLSPVFAVRRRGFNKSGGPSLYYQFDRPKWWGLQLEANFDSSTFSALGGGYNWCVTQVLVRALCEVFTFQFLLCGPVLLQLVKILSQYELFICPHHRHGTHARLCCGPGRGLCDGMCVTCYHSNNRDLYCTVLYCTVLYCVSLVITVITEISTPGRLQVTSPPPTPSDCSEDLLSEQPGAGPPRLSPHWLTATNTGTWLVRPTQQ